MLKKFLFSLVVLVFLYFPSSLAGQNSSSGLRLLRATSHCPSCHPNVRFGSSPEGRYTVLLADSTSSFGQWRLQYSLPSSVQACRFQVRHDAPQEAVSAGLLTIRVSWQNAEGQNLRSCYLNTRTPGLFARDLVRPPEATSVTLNLGVRYLTNRQVTFQDVVCQPIPRPRRQARIVVSKCSPATNGKATCQDNQARMETVFRRLIQAGEKPDLVVFPETLLTRSVPGLGVDKGAQTIPGPHTDWLASYARKLHTNVVASLREISDGRYYNSAVVLDRQGKIVGVYRKTHLTVGEYEEGYHWGTDLPVFKLDFGTIGVLICWDMWFPQAIRTLKLKGAELIAYPIAATNSNYYDTMWKTRASENGLYIAASISGGHGGCPARIVAPNMTVLAETNQQQTYAAATVDLADPPTHVNFLSVDWGTGEGGTSYIHERNPQAYQAK